MKRTLWPTAKLVRPEHEAEESAYKPESSTKAARLDWRGCPIVTHAIRTALILPCRTQLMGRTLCIVPYVSCYTAKFLSAKEKKTLSYYRSLPHCLQIVHQHELHSKRALRTTAVWSQSRFDSHVEMCFISMSSACTSSMHYLKLHVKHLV